MSNKKLAPVALALLCATSALAQKDREVWLTLGSETFAPMQATLRGNGQKVPAALAEKNGVTVVRVLESEIPAISEFMHHSLNRCAGFITHDTEEEALAALEPQKAVPTALQTLVAYTLDNANVVNGLMPELKASNITGTISALSTGYSTRLYTSQTGVQAANWIRDLWQGYATAAGRADVTVQLYSHSFVQPSVILTIPGKTLPNEVVVLGGHLDSINGSGGSAPGADDDASGIASLSEVIRAALLLKYEPARTVKFMGYAGEEGGLLGSKDIANNHKNTGVNVVGVLQLDMTNYKGSAVDVALMSDYTNAAQNQFVGTLLETYVGASWSNSTCGYGCSDHASWTNAGFPASMPFEAMMSQMNPSIHTASDTLAQSDSSGVHALKFSKLAAAFMAELAKGTLDGVGGGSPPALPTATFDTALKAPRCATVGPSCGSGTLLNGRGSLGPEANAPNTINTSCADGTAGAYLSSESVERIKVTTLDGSNLAPGKTVRVETTVWAYSTSSDSLDLYYAANAASPSWTLIGTLKPVATGMQTLVTTYTLPSGSNQAVRAHFRRSGSASACGTGTYDDHDDLAFAAGSGVPDTTAPTVSITAPTGGGTVSGTATVSATASDAEGVTQVEFYVDGVLKGSVTSAPYSYAWDTRTATNGSHSLVAKAYDFAGNVGTSTTIAVTVSNTATTSASYDTGLKAPRCATVGAACDSGTLLNGRGTKGPEVNAPNTINNSCADGASGTYKKDESVERVKVSTTDGSAFAAGKTVRVETTVWAYSTSADSLDLYYTANAASPSWTLIGTFKPTGTGSQTLSATYTLPAGASQAVRARFRYNGTAGPCNTGTGTYDDHDDLAFAVTP
ncbi:M20/M25/M40 family metallo-hydrolase [Myxococcaceae bacterium GXIMD 01537]